MPGSRVKARFSVLPGRPVNVHVRESIEPEAAQGRIFSRNSL